MKNLTLVLLAVLISSIYSCKKKDTDIGGITAKTTADFRDKYTGTYNIYESGSTEYYPEGAPSYATHNNHSGSVTISYTSTDSVTVYWNPSSPVKMAAMQFSYNTGSKILYAVNDSGRFFRNTSPIGGDSGGFVGTDSIYQIYYNSTGHSSSVDTMLGHK
jgi:hypothetical protein